MKINPKDLDKLGFDLQHGSEALDLQFQQNYKAHNIRFPENDQNSCRESNSQNTRKKPIMVQTNTENNFNNTRSTEKSNIKSDDLRNDYIEGKKSSPIK